MTRSILFTLCALAACSAPASKISPAACGTPCSSSDACRNDFGACRVCFGGVCAESLPAQPLEPDAGVDAVQSTFQSTGADAPERTIP